MKTFICLVVLAGLVGASIAGAGELISLEITGSWTATDYDVSSTGPTVGAMGIPEENDDLVFGTAPADGFTTFTLMVDKDDVQFFPQGTMGITHDFYGYSTVSLVGTHTFGSASWVTSDILTGLEGPGGATAALWTDEDISLVSPTRVSFRMFGNWEGSSADLFVGSRTPTTIGLNFLLHEYYAGEVIRSNSYTASSVPAVLAVDIDVKPGSDSNPINCKGSSGVIPVALLTTEDFDALTVDHQTVVFGPAGAGETHVKGLNRNPHNGDVAISPMEGVVKRHEEDVDGDGDMDLLFHFRFNETGIQCGDTEVTLTGETYDGQTVTGTDEIRTVPANDETISPETSVSISPNPFNPQTKISFKIDRTQHIKVDVYDIRGRCVATVAEGVRDAGEYSVVWQGKDQTGRNVPSGTYFFRVDTGGSVETMKAVLLK